MRKKRGLWRASLFLAEDQRDTVEELATKIRRATGYKPTASEIIRAAIDAGLDALRGEKFTELAELIGEKSPRAAAPDSEEWLRRRMMRKERK